MLKDLYKLYKILGKSGVFYPDALWATAQFLYAYLKYGSSLITLAKWSALRFPNHVAIVDDHRQVTFRELVANAEMLATGLEQGYGIKPEQTIGLLGRNGIDFVEVLLACEMLGINVLLLHPHFVAENLERLQGQLDILICDDEFQGNTRQPLLNTISFSSLSTIKSTGRLLKFIRKSNITLLTSGTTGQPKIISRRPRLSLKTLAGLLEALQLTANSKTLLTLPLSHGHGLATLAFNLLFGATLYIFRKSRTEHFMRCVRENSIDTVVLVPTILYRLLQEQERLRVHKIISGSAPLDEKLATQTLQTFGDVLYNLYGSSELGLISLATPDDLRLEPKTVGRVLPGVNLQIQNNHIYVVKNGHSLDTGDMGYLDEVSRLFLLGRSDDLLICGGENVHPRMIEERVNTLDYVLESAVVGVPDAEYGHAVHLYAVLKPPGSRDELAKDLEQLFSKTLRPKEIFIVETLPRTASGKIIKHQLNEMSKNPTLTTL
jgi:acyl-CoA synthetase (AMP-forming)/AMP-acid ligase II